MIIIQPPFTQCIIECMSGFSRFSCSPENRNWKCCLLECIGPFRHVIFSIPWSTNVHERPSVDSTHCNARRSSLPIQMNGRNASLFHSNEIKIAQDEVNSETKMAAKYGNRTDRSSYVEEQYPLPVWVVRFASHSAPACSTCRSEPAVCGLHLCGAGRQK